MDKSEKIAWKAIKKGDYVIKAAYYDDLASMYRDLVSARILLLRVKMQISQHQLANFMSVTPQAVTMIEKGKRAPSFELLCKLAEFFNVSLDYLVGRSDESEVKK